MTPAYDLIDAAFRHIVAPIFPPEEVWSGGLFTEGPAYFPAGKYLLFVDLPNDRILRHDEISGQTVVFRQDCGHPNGQTVDQQGRLLTCEHRYRRVSRTEHDGSILTLADRWNGKRFNSPNDVVVTSDGAIWFTDPPYGLMNDMDGAKAEPEIEGCHVYRIDPITAKVEAVITDMVMPNGLAFSADESLLYVVDSGASHVADGPAHLRVFNVDPHHRISGGAVLMECRAGIYDGLRLDADDRIWITAGDGVHCHAPDGTMLGKILLGKIAGNLTFAGPKRNMLYVCASSSLFRIRLKINGRMR